jgi:hypothetical protein
MIRTKWIAVFVLAAACTTLAFGADANPAAPPKAAPKDGQGSILGGRDLGLIFNLVDPFTLAGAGDGMQTGFGMKLWLNDRSVVRGLLDLDFHTDPGTTTTIVGLSAAYEHHFQKGKVSPYAGGILGTQVLIGAAPNLVLYAGGLLGVEVRVFESLALFAEYSLLVSMDEPSFDVELDIGNNAHLGVIVYLQ